MQEQKRVIPTKLAHFVLRSNHFEETKQWYMTVLQARIQFANDFLAFLTYDDEHHRLALANMPNLPNNNGSTAGLDHVAFTYASIGDLVFTYKRLKAAGILPVWCVNHGLTTSMYYKDPDGNRVEMQVDNYASVEALNAWFHSGEFKKNPIGTNYDPDRLVEKFEGGTPVEELIQPGAI
ncbi:MAG: VOC family protein [Candidatus Binataceae bacterium]